MKTEVLKQEKNVVSIKVEFEAKEFADAVKKAVAELSQNANIPGFRKGRAPRNVIEMRFGRDAVYNQAVDGLLNKNLSDIIADYDLETIDQPTLTKVYDIKNGEPVSCELEFEVTPEIVLPELGDIEVERLKVNITDDMVEKLIKQSRRNYAHVKEAGRPAGDEDTVHVTFTTRLVEDGATEAEPRKTAIDLSDEQTRKEIRDALIGHNKGDVVECEFDVESEYQDKSLAGKRIHYKMTIESVAEHVLPDLDEKFFKQFFGDNTDILTEDAFRAKMRENLIASMEKDAQDDAAARTLTEITKRCTFDVPMTMLKRQVASYHQNDEQEAKTRYGRDLKSLLGLDDKEREKNYWQLLTLRSEANVRRMLVLNAVQKKYDITTEQADVEAELDRRAAVYGVDRKTLVSYFYKTEAAIEQLTEEVNYAKIMSHIMTLVKIKDVDKLSEPEPEPATMPAAEDKPAN